MKISLFNFKSSDCSNYDVSISLTLSLYIVKWLPMYHSQTDCQSENGRQPFYCQTVRANYVTLSILSMPAYLFLCRDDGGSGTVFLVSDARKSTKKTTNTSNREVWRLATGETTIWSRRLLPLSSEQTGSGGCAVRCRNTRLAPRIRCMRTFKNNEDLSETTRSPSDNNGLSKAQVAQ